MNANRAFSNAQRNYDNAEPDIDEVRIALAEQAADEVADAFNRIPDDIMAALGDSMPIGWYAKAQDAWCATRFAELETEHMSSLADRGEYIYDMER